MRKERKDLKTISSATLNYTLMEDQYFCELPKSYEIWVEKPLPGRVVRIPKSRIIWIEKFEE